MSIKKLIWELCYVSIMIWTCLSRLWFYEVTCVFFKYLMFTDDEKIINETGAETVRVEKLVIST